MKNQENTNNVKVSKFLYFWSISSQTFYFHNQFTSSTQTDHTPFEVRKINFSIGFKRPFQYDKNIVKYYCLTLVLLTYFQEITKNVKVSKKNPVLLIYKQSNTFLSHSVYILYSQGSHTILGKRRNSKDTQIFQLFSKDHFSLVTNFQEITKNVSQ